ncbi:hypothetical protein [Christiangramia aquimixticola]|uniref:hypothetical protein n=1 Tax=Christiangramia aquimixticola TaxID=1697558 RepID=UPI003AA8C527
MLPNRSIIQILIIGLLINVLFTSCFKDVDFSRTDEIKLSPDLEVDLIHYQLNRDDFIDSETGEYTSIIRDTVRLEYLDDSYIQDGLLHAEFLFRHENTFSDSIRSNIKFLAVNNRRQFNVAYTIPAGEIGAPAFVDTLHIMDESKISKVRRSFKMVVELEMLGSGTKLDGELKFSSKGYYRFKF